MDFCSLGTDMSIIYPKYTVYTLGIILLVGKPHHRITQLDSISPQHDSKENRTNPTTCLRMQSMDPARCVPHNLFLKFLQGPCEHTKYIPYRFCRKPCVTATASASEPGALTHQATRTRSPTSSLGRFHKGRKSIHLNVYVFHRLSSTWLDTPPGRDKCPTYPTTSTDDRFHSTCISASQAGSASLP